MIIHTVPSGPLATNSYVVACQKTRLAAIFDPAKNSAETLIRFLEEKKLAPIIILLTHSHWDHIADVASLKEKCQIPVFVHSKDAGNLMHPGSDGLPCWIDIPEVQPDGFFKEGDFIDVGEIKFKVIETPGHTPGGVCFYCPEYHVLISGDTLFQGTIGNVSFSTGRPGLMWESLKKLSRLPAETIVYPGHGPATKIGDEPWLSRAEEIFGN